ncbi:MAG: hypothetical protein H8E12_06270 [Rhodobacteraceae bacterium]|nr:hypothetical protein [Paracoccaceae bacterium]
MRIGIDCDGVLRQFIDSVSRVISKHYPDKANELRMDNVDWGFTSWIPFWTEAQTEQFIFKVHFWEIFTTALPYPTALQDYLVLKQWAQNNGHTLVLVSAQRNTTILPTTYWIAQNGFDFKEIHYTHDKWEIDVDFLIDDSQTKLAKFQQRSVVNGTPICMKRHWNKDVWDTYPCITRLSELTQII